MRKIVYCWSFQNQPKLLHQEALLKGRVKRETKTCNFFATLRQDELKNYVARLTTRIKPISDCCKLRKVVAESSKKFYFLEQNLNMSCALLAKSNLGPLFKDSNVIKLSDIITLQLAVFHFWYFFQSYQEHTQIQNQVVLHDNLCHLKSQSKLWKF